MNLAMLAQGAQAVRTAFPTAKPVAGLILGSGWRAAATSFGMQGRLDYRVLFRIEHPAKFVTFTGRHIVLFPQATKIKAVPQARRGAVVAGRQDAPFFN